MAGESCAAVRSAPNGAKRVAPMSSAKAAQGTGHSLCGAVMHIKQSRLQVSAKTIPHGQRFKQKEWCTMRSSIAGGVRASCEMVGTSLSQ
jgi:hypothetical protein